MRSVAMVPEGSNALSPDLAGMIKPRDQRSSARGFTLTELLVVIAIIVLMGALLAPSIVGVLSGSNLTRAGQVVFAQLSLARQYALSKNRIVEIRFYRFSSPDAPGESAGNPPNGRFRAIQLFEISDSGAMALGRVQNLPTPIIIDSGSALSSLIGAASAAPSVPTTQNGTALNVPIPQVGLNYDSVCFRVRPDGSTNLPESVLWCFTLHNLVEGDAISAPPKNYLTVQIDASNGHIKTYRP